MSVFTGRQPRGAGRERRREKRAEAIERNARTLHGNRRWVREGRPDPAGGKKT